MLRYLKLISGDELIGVVDDEESEYDLRVLKNPWRLLLTNRGYVPTPMPAKNLTISNSHVLCEGDVDDELAQIYLGQHGGIVSPPKSSFVLP